MGARQGPDGGRCPPGRWDRRRGAGGGDLSDSLRPSRLDSKPRTSVGGLDLLMLPMGRPPVQAGGVSRSRLRPCLQRHGQEVGGWGP